jgi:pimeloyl-ACP methyl ester carboxylesterase
MSSIITAQGILHYQSIGRGRPLILLHGWINSWDVWREAMLTLAGEEAYRVYALDFWGFGRSATAASEADRVFRLDSYVEMVREFMERMGIAQAPLAGHSMGGTVALKLALRYPQLVSRVMVVGSPIDGGAMNFFLKLVGYGPVANLAWRVPFVIPLIMRLVLARDSRPIRTMILRDYQRTTLESFFRSIGDLRDTDLRGRLCELRPPALGIYGARDNIVSPVNARLMAEELPHDDIVMMNGSRHFPMADEPDQFLDAMRAFLRESVGRKDRSMLA